MGCFLACFGSSKDQKRRTRSKNKVLPRDQRHGIPKPRQSTFPPEEDISAESTNLIPEVPDKFEEQRSLSTRKKVSFNTNVKAYEPISVHGSTESLPEDDKDIKKQKGDSSCLSHSQSEDDSITSSVQSYPPNHRYQNCRDSDDEADEYESEEDSDLDDEDEELEDYGDYGDDEDEQIFVPTKSVESRTEISSAQAFMEEEEVKKTAYNRNARDRSVYVHPVLNPVENLSQWKAVKSKGPSPPPLNPQKENLKLEQEPPRISSSYEPIFKHPSFSFKSKSDQQPKSQTQEIAVDASLSNWLFTSETTPTRKTRTGGLETVSHEKSSFSEGSNSLVSIEDRPILGALTVEELKQFSASSSSPRKSPSRSPDEMAIIGTVGTYWRHTEQESKDSTTASSYKGIPNTTSKYREDKRVNWHSTPFETRLERALNRPSAEA